ncbi:MAG TPA: hypothetical protein VK070_11235 [Acidimicrobiia bacterium]|nr:hypothetical protein [Acidimicrobiia bacterium]
MLKLSDNAAAALASIREAEGIPEGHDTRISAERQPSGDLALRLEFVESADASDHRAEHAGTEIYLDPILAEPLSDSIMDVQSGDQGLSFVFLPQNPEAPPA